MFSKVSCLEHTVILYGQLFRPYCSIRMAAGPIVPQYQGDYCINQTGVASGLLQGYSTAYFIKLKRIGEYLCAE